MHELRATLPFLLLTCLTYLTPVASQNYNYDYGNAGDYNGGAVEKDERIMCYTCHYHRINAESNQGDQRCDDPFQSTGIPAVPCEGSCAKTLTHHGGGEYMVVRSCLLNCQDVTDPGKSIRCCGDTYCNGARATGAAIKTGTVFLASVVLGRLLL